MRRLKLNRAFVLILLLVAISGSAQEVVTGVTIERTSATVYKIRYGLNAEQAVRIDQVLLKIIRRRDGVVAEVFSQRIQPDLLMLQGRKQYSYTWETDAETVKKGDELQARVLLTYKTPLPADEKISGSNKLPKADAGNFLDVDLPVAKSVILDGSRSVDEDGSIRSFRWKQIAGPSTLVISNRDSAIAYLDGDFQSGTYAFELTVTDDRGATASGRTVMLVKTPVNTLPAPMVNKPDIKKDSVRIQTKVVKASSPSTKLKGGPLNTVINLAVPGLGHYFVSGDYNGKNRKPAVFGITALYAASIGGSFYFQSRSDQQYRKYTELLNYREYQRDPAGVITGVRGANQAEADVYLKRSKDAHRNALISLGVAGTILVGDAVITFIKGSRNKKEWKRSATSFHPGIFIYPGGAGITAGVQIKF